MTYIRQYPLGGIDIELELSDEAFQPVLITEMIAKHVAVPAQGTVLDVGCGVGALAIMAALKGAGRVMAVDIMSEACRLADLNAIRNKVQDKLTVACGSLFEPVGDRTFDLIIDDVSAVADEVARLSPWYPDTIPTGGTDGADVVVPMIEAAPKHLNPGGVLYFPTGTISNVARTLAAATAAFGSNIELVDERLVPFASELNEHLATMLRLKADGIIDFVTKRSRHLWTLQLYRAWV